MTELECTCEAPVGAAHNPGCPRAAIWTPPEKTDDNTKRMAWLMFLECWKVEMAKPHRRQASPDPMWDTTQTYNNCLKTAKIVRKLEQAPQ